jgi:hypothetical protein
LIISERIRLIEALFSEALKFIERGDPIESSEKFYKAAEECIKSLAEKLSLEEAKAAEERGRWTVTLLEKAVGELTDKFGIDIENGWDAANHLHVWGFHEIKLDLEDVKRRIPKIRRLIEMTTKILESRQ